MSFPLRIRAFEPGDYAAIARVNAGAAPSERQDFEPRTEAAFRDFDASFDPARHVLRRYVAEQADTGHIVGFTHVFHMPWLFDPGWFWCAVRCEAAHRRQGIGEKLYAEAKAELARRGATSVRMMAPEASPELAAQLERRGFREVLRSWEFLLDLEQLDERHFSDRGAGPIATLSLPEVQARDPRWLEKLAPLYAAVVRDVPIPGIPNPDASPQWLADHLERWPTSLPDACFIATEGDSFLGLSVAHRHEEDPTRVNQLLTGVSPEHRGRRVGKALKIASLRYAKRHGYRRFWTAVESNNPQMLAINKTVGFVHSGGLILFEAKLDAALA